MAICALVIGHKKASPGAVNDAANLTEFDFNDRLSLDIQDSVTGVRVERVYRRTYQQLPADLNQLKPDFIISLHCNAYNRHASGTEVLYYHRSESGKKWARVLQDRLVRALHLRDRGIKARTAEDRGGFLLRYTTAPCMIAEPFFIDNDCDLAVATAGRQALVGAYAEAIQEIAASVQAVDFWPRWRPPMP